MNKKTVSARIGEYAYNKIKNAQIKNKSQYIEQAIICYNENTTTQQEIKTINAQIREIEAIHKICNDITQTTITRLQKQKKKLQNQLNNEIKTRPTQYTHSKTILQNIQKRKGTITQEQYQIQANKIGITITQLKQWLQEDEQTQRRQETQ